MGSAMSRPGRPQLKRHVTPKELANLGITNYDVVLSFDALGTLYRFKEPFANQYLKVARRCGMKLSTAPEALDKAFKVAFRDISREYPNYGKGKLDNPQVWWETLIEQTFDEATNGASLPPSLSEELYTHFSSGAAYELFPEVKNMFARHRSQKSRSFGLEFPNLKESSYIMTGPNRPIVGVVTNSDPRVTSVLRDLGLKVGVTERERVQAETSLPSWGERPKAVASDWNPDNDIDFVCTSYDAGSEKPDKAIFDHALMLADAAGRSLDDHYMQYLLAQKFNPQLLLKIESRLEDMRRVLVWAHVGDDLGKDIHGASAWGATAYYVKRKARITEEEEIATVGRRYLLKDLSRVPGIDFNPE